MDFHLQLPFQDWTLSLQQRGEIAVIEVNTILASWHYVIVEESLDKYHNYNFSSDLPV